MHLFGDIDFMLIKPILILVRASGKLVVKFVFGLVFGRLFVKFGLVKFDQYINRHGAA